MIKFKKILSFALSLTLISTIFLSPTYANNSTSNDISYGKSLSTANLLSKNDVITLAKYHIGNYMKTDVQTKGKTILVGKDFINLYDLDDNLFAYIVPLVENDKEIGYITIGAIEDGYDSYEIFIDDNAVKDFREKLKVSGAKLIFTPPYSYVVKYQDKYIGTTKDVNNNQDISESVAKNNSEVKKIYQSIRSTENKMHIQKLLKQTQKPIMGIDYSDSTCEDIRLQHEDAFVPVYQNSTVYYGGDQNWWGNTTKANRGCGPTAAANITCYAARNYPTLYGNLYAPTGITKDEYLIHMNSLYQALDPSIIGEFTLTGFRNDVKSFASGRGVYLSDYYNDCSSTIDNVATFIKAGLDADSPVACLNRQVAGYAYCWHWMTITKYYRDLSTDSRWIAVSTWGKRKSIDFKAYYDSTHSWGGGFVYFE